MGQDASESALGIKATAEKLQQAGTSAKSSMVCRHFANACRATVNPGMHQNRGSTASAPGAAREAKVLDADAIHSAVIAATALPESLQHS